MDLIERLFDKYDPPTSFPELFLKPGSMIGLVNYLKRSGGFDLSKDVKREEGIRLKEGTFYACALAGEVERIVFYGFLAYQVVSSFKN